MNRFLYLTAASFLIIFTKSMAFTPSNRAVAFVVSSKSLSTMTTGTPTPTATTTRLWDSNTGGIEQIEFKIYPDGRIEETVRGIRGNNCHHVTEAINEKLGEVVASVPTEELYEQEVVLDQTLIQTTSSDWQGSSTW